jgi:hypothetical protein
VTQGQVRSGSGLVLAISGAVVLVAAGVVLALALTRGGSSAAAPGLGVLPTAPATVATTAAALPSTPRVRPGGGAWPVGLTAWTVVLATLSKHGHTRAAAERIARGVTAPGIAVLDSSSHPRLRPALWIVFAGRYATRAQAGRAARRVQAAGAPHAVVERLTG